MTLLRSEDLNDALDNDMMNPDDVNAAPRSAQRAIQPSSSEDDVLSFMVAQKLKTTRAVANPEHPWMKHHEFVLIRTAAEVEELVDRCLKHGKCSLDLETQGLDTRIDYVEDGSMRTRHQIVGYCISVDGSAGYYIPVRHHRIPGDEEPNVDDVAAAEAGIRRLCLAAQPVIKPECPDQLGGRDWLEPPKVVIGFWHAKFDQEMLLPLTGLYYWHPDGFEDFMLAYYCAYSGDKDLGLKSKSREKLRDKEGNPYTMIGLQELFVGRRQIAFAEIYPSEPGVTKYACSDAICTRLHWNTPDVQKVLTDPKYSRTYRIEKQIIQVMRSIERNRMLIDKAEVRRLIEEAKEEEAEYTAKILTLAESQGFHNFNPGSTKQLSDFLFTEKGLDLKPKPAKNEKSGYYKTDAATLERLIEGQEDQTDNVLVWIVKYRQIGKIIGTYLNGMLSNTDEHNQLRFSFNQVGAATGRFTAPAEDPAHGYSGIPIHGIPARNDPKRPKCANSMRRIFIARPGYGLAKCDYSGQELRIATNVSGERVWIKEFLEGTGDLHTITARSFFGKDEVTKDERAAGKRANFALIYGGGYQAIVRATGCTEQEGKRRKIAFDKSVPDFAKWVKSQHAAIKKNLGVWTPFGRWIAVPDANSDDHTIKAACERYSTNYPIQGCLQPSARVLTAQGYKTVADILDSGGTGWTWTGSNWADFRILDKGEWQYAEIELTDGTLIPCDTRHKLLVVTDTGYVWREYEELRPGDQIATSIARPVQFPGKALPAFEVGERSNPSPSMPKGCETDLWFWLGYYFGGDWKEDEKGYLTYRFGDHETVTMDRCVGFWSRWGLHPKIEESTQQPDRKVSTQYTVTICSADLTRWLSKLGIDPLNAHTKRLPNQVFCEPLLYRQAFIKGLMASNGHRTRNGNLYSIHFCQADLLRDVKLLLRTVGVESSLHGPCDCTDEHGQTTQSYRLDINRRMLRATVDGDSARLPKFHNMVAPPFLVQALIGKYPDEQAASFPNESCYNLYLRMRSGGTVTLTEFQHMLDVMGYQIDQPIYAYKQLKEKRDLPTRGPTYTLSVNDPLHRFEAEGVITKNSGADIMKISLVTLYKLFYRQGWLRHGGDDSVRMLLTVHDEIVFEIRLDRMQQVLPLIVETMEFPWKIPNEPRWVVPLVVEPDVDLTWAAKYPWDAMVRGRSAKPGEVLKDNEEQIGDRIYHKLPDWLAPYVNRATTQTGPIAMVRPVATGTAEVEPSAVPPPRTPKPTPETEVVQYCLSVLTSNTAKLVGVAAMEARDVDNGKLLCLVDVEGNVLIDPKQGIRVDPDQFGRELFKRNLGSGRIDSGKTK